MLEEKLLHKDLSFKIVGLAMQVHTELGFGFLEKVYENALTHELSRAGIAVAQQKALTVLYNGIAVGEYFADLLVEDEMLIELKAVPAIDAAHRAQCLNYLRATGLRLCLLMNFGTPRLEVRRVVLDL